LNCIVALVTPAGACSVATTIFPGAVVAGLTSRLAPEDGAGVPPLAPVVLVAVPVVVVAGAALGEVEAGGPGEVAEALVVELPDEPPQPVIVSAMTAQAVTAPIRGCRFTSLTWRLFDGLTANACREFGQPAIRMPQELPYAKRKLPRAGRG
jgi:hypothetical protein